MLLAGCMTSGSLDLELELPSNADLRPTGMTTITVLATPPNGSPIANTAVIDGTHFSAGDLPIGNGVLIDVLLHDVSNRLVGVGEAPTPVDLPKNQATTVTMPVRRPFVYTSSGSALYSFDPTLDPRDMKFQGQLSGLSSPQLSVSVGGDVLVVASASQLQIVDTATHMVTGQSIAVPGTVHDIAEIPGTRQIAVATSAGVSVVNVDNQNVQNIAASSIDRVTVGGTSVGLAAVYGLVGRVAPPVGPLDTCTGMSSLVTIDLKAGSASAPVALGAAVADVAGDPLSSRVYAAEPCAGKVQVVNAGEVADFTALERAAVVAVAGGRLFAAGSHASTPACFTSAGNPAPCPQNIQPMCPSAASGTQVAWATSGGQVIVESIPLTGGDPIVLTLPPRRETMISTDDPAMAEAQVLPALGLQPIDLVVLPGAQFVGVVTQSSYYTDARADSLNQIVLPCLLATTGDWMLVDMASSSIATRVRTQCKLITGPSALEFQNWACDAPPVGEQNGTGIPDYLPVSIGALFGAR
jgi:hypothetical protein